MPDSFANLFADLLGPRFLALYFCIAAGVYVHYRGRVRHSFQRQLADHSTLLAPYNVLMYLFSAVPNRPYVDVARFPELAPLTEQWQMIRDEGLKLLDEGHIRAAAKHNDLGFNSFFKTGWKRFYLKWYDQPLPSAQALCPRTTALVQSLPSINAAMYAWLPVGAKLGKHRDPFAGSLRYHLGLVTPNSDDCYILVDGERYFWRDGEAVVFDETYIHTAENRSDVSRLILFCDIERPLNFAPIVWLNQAFKRTVIRASQTENVPGEKVGVLNHLFGFVYRFRLLGKRIKAKSPFAHYTLKWLIFGSLFWLVFFSW